MQETLVWFLGWERSPKEEIGCPLQYSWASLVAQMVRNPPSMQDTWVLSLGWEDPLEEGMATLSSILSCLKNPHGQRSLAGYHPWSGKELDMTEWQRIAQYWELMLILVESQMLSTLPSTKCVFNTLQPVTKWRECQWKWKSLSRVRLFAILWTIQSMKFSGPEHWPIPAPENFPDPGIQPGSPALQTHSSSTELSGMPKEPLESDL